jgi:hypothetical protein
MLGSEQYSVYTCKVHNKIIHYFKRDEHLKGFHCWDCIRDANNQKSNREAKLRHAREQFSVEFSHLWSTAMSGGIVSAKIVENEIQVSIESSADAFNEVPNEYRGFTVSKQIVGAM